MTYTKKQKFELHNYLDVKGSPNEIIKKILKNISELKDIGYAGYSEKKWLRLTLKRLILDRKGDNQIFSYKKEYNKKIKSVCKEAINKCDRYIHDKVHIFLFPTFDKFAIKKMNGVNGFCPWKNTLLIFMNFVNNWEEHLKETIIHELAHALSPYAKPDASIGDWIILEGIAENFKDFIFPGHKSKWTKALSKKESKRIFNEIRLILKENNFKEYSEIFYGTGKYPLWAGYSIGYYLVKDYLKKHKKIDWNKLLREDPKKILLTFTS